MKETPFEAMFDLEKSLHKLDREETEIVVLRFFKGNKDKTAVWFTEPNPMMGGISPNKYAEMHSNRALLAWVDHMLERNNK